MKKVFALLFTLTLLLGLVSPTAFAAAGAGGAQGPKDGKGRQHDLKDPLSDKQKALRAKALELKLKGDPKAQGKVVEVAKGQYVELAREKTDEIFVILAEFGDTIHPATGGTPGPLHNQIAKPDRAVDNNTIRQADYSRQHFENLYFSQADSADSVANYYESQSSGRYSVTGQVGDWVKVTYNEARYGSNKYGDQIVWDLIKEGVNIWTQNQLAAGKSLDQVKTDLAKYDVWDRFDYDADGNFDEPDGYIDHFQIVHAGVGEETGGGAQGEDAIWSHKWYAFQDGIGSTGPAINKAGGTQIGDTGIWVGNYTIQPENGGLGVFAHEYGHDLGLPDEYDTSYAGESASAFWTLMASGSYTGDGSINGIGTRPVDMNAWDKFQLGWLNYEVAYAGKASSHKVGPAETNTKQAQAVITVLPDKQVTYDLGKAYAGAKFFFSGAGDNLDNFMTKSVALPAGATLTAKVRYDIEVDWDYAYVVVSTDNGATWTTVPTNLSTDKNPNGQNFGKGITGSSAGKWVDLSADLSAFGGKTALVGFRYWTDVAETRPGFAADDVVIAGGAADGAETETGWTFKGFKITNGTEVKAFFNAYIAEFRQYRGFDTTLQTGPYNFGFADTKPEWVEHYPYQDGLLISYWDTSYTDNNVGAHPGGGLILPIDAHPTMLKNASGANWRTRIQVYDATFGLEATDALTLHVNSVPKTLPSLPSVKAFDDTKDWYDESGNALQAGSANPPKTGTTIEVINYSAQGNFMQVQVKPSK